MVFYDDKQTKLTISIAELLPCLRRLRLNFKADFQGIILIFTAVVAAVTFTKVEFARD